MSKALLALAVLLAGCGGGATLAPAPTPVVTAEPTTAPTPVMTAEPATAPTPVVTAESTRWTRDRALCYLRALDAAWQPAALAMVPVIQAESAERAPSPGALRLAAAALDRAQDFSAVDHPCTPPRTYWAPECAGDAPGLVTEAAYAAGGFVFLAEQGVRDPRGAARIAGDIIEANNAMIVAWASCSSSLD